MALDTMIQLFGMKQLGHPTQVRFDREALIPRSTFATVDVGWWRVFLAQSQVGKRDSLALVADRQGAKDIIRLIGPIPCPVDHLTVVIDQPRQFDADDPAPIRDTFLADLLLAPPFAARMDQLHPVGVHNGKEARFGQKLERQRSIVAQEPRKPRALGQGRKPDALVRAQPAIKGAETPAFQAKEQADGDHLTGIHMGIGTLVDMTKLVVYHAKQADDDLVRGHTVLQLMCSVHPHRRGRFCVSQIDPVA